MNERSFIFFAVLPSRTPPESSRQRRKDARAGEILSAALDVFHAKGFAATTIADIARAAQVAAGTVYLYFPNKQELFKAAVRESIVPNLDRMEAALALPTPAEQLRRVLELWTQGMAQARGSLLKLILAEGGNFPELAAFYREEVSGRGRGLLLRIVEAGIAAGDFRPCDPLTVVRMLAAPIAMAGLWQHALPDQTYCVTPTEMVDPLLDMLLHGLSNPVSRPSLA